MLCSMGLSLMGCPGRAQQDFNGCHDERVKPEQGDPLSNLGVVSETWAKGQVHGGVGGTRAKGQSGAAGRQHKEQSRNGGSHKAVS